MENKTILNGEYKIPSEQTLISREVKQEQWGDGEWLDEPDFMIWEYKGIKCCIMRLMIWDKRENSFLSLGHLNGYVQIPKEHSWFGKDYYKIEIDVHGGLTFSDFIKEGEYWIGFDCAHSMDYIPSLQKMLSHSIEIQKLRNDLPPNLHSNFDKIFHRTYKNIAYVKRECEKLADQVIKNAKDGD